MKAFGLLTAVLVAFQWCSAQNPSEFSTGSLRMLVSEMELQHKNNVEQLMRWNDSLQVDKKKWQAGYDSLYSDSLALSTNERLLIRMDAALSGYSVAPSQKMYSTVKAVFLELDFGVGEAQDYMRELNALLLELALEFQDFELAYRIQNKIHAYDFGDWKLSDDARIQQIDSLKKAGADMSAKSRTDIDILSKLAMQWHLTAVAFIILFVVMIIVLAVLLRRWKKQRRSLAARASDTSEQEALVHKLEEARREIQELKLLAKKKVDSAPAQVSVPPVPVGSGISASEITDWNDQVQQALIKIKTHCEAGKNSMSVPTYMSIINDTTRLSSQVAKKTEQWIALLNATK